MLLVLVVAAFCNNDNKLHKQNVLIKLHKLVSLYIIIYSTLYEHFPGVKGSRLQQN